MMLAGRWVPAARLRHVLRRASSSAPVLVLGNGAAGAEKQAVALAEALGLPHTLVRAVPSPAAMRLPLRAQLAAQAVLGPQSIGVQVHTSAFPLLAISCGRASVPASVALRRASGGITATVHVQRPLCAASQFDLVVAPRHDYVAQERVPPNVVLTDGALSGLSVSALERARARWEGRAGELPRPRLGLLIGGPMSRRWWQRPLVPQLDGRSASALVRAAARSASASGGGSLLLTISRRTPAAVVAAVGAELEAAREAGLGVWWWRGAEDGPNPYEGMLAWSDYLLVTPDSISMASEAAAAGLPLYIPWTAECRGRLRAFHSSMIASGRARRWVDGAPLEPPELWSGVGRADTAACPHGAPGLGASGGAAGLGVSGGGVGAADVPRVAARVAQMLLARAALGQAALDPHVEARLRGVADAGRAAGALYGSSATAARPPVLLHLYQALSEVCAPFLAAGGALRAGRPRAMLEALALSDLPWGRGESLRPAVDALQALEADSLPREGFVREGFVLWVHAASVGESLSALPVVRALLRSDAAARVLITTSTEAALRRLALEHLGPRVALRLRPVDAPSVVRRLLRVWRPTALVLIESELWPAVLREAANARIPTALLNGRLSATSARRWSQAPPMLATLQLLLRGFHVTLAQSAPMADVLRHLGARSAVCVGDLKQMRGAAPPDAAQLSALREAIGGRREVWLAASTHEGEEEAVLEAHAALRASHPRLLLILAPRHTHRGAHVAALSRACGWHTERRCDIPLARRKWHALPAGVCALTALSLPPVQVGRRPRDARDGRVRVRCHGRAGGALLAVVRQLCGRLTGSPRWAQPARGRQGRLSGPPRPARRRHQPGGRGAGRHVPAVGAAGALRPRDGRGSGCAPVRRSSAQGHVRGGRGGGGAARGRGAAPGLDRARGAARAAAARSKRGGRRGGGGAAVPSGTAIAHWHGHAFTLLRVALVVSGNGCLA